MLKLYTEYSGAEFNTIYKNKILYIFPNNDLTHNGFKYQLGLNSYDCPFRPISKHSKGGIYFCEES